VRFLLNIVYMCLLAMAFPWILYRAVVLGKYRGGWGQKLGGRLPCRKSGSLCVWFHAVSVGEVNALRPLIERFQASCPRVDIVVSTTTNTGLEVAQRIYSGRDVFFCPLDFTWAVRQAVDRIRPDVLVLAELELWPNLIHEINRRGGRVALVNGRLGEKSFRRYRRVRPLVKRMLDRVEMFAVQHKAHARRFKALGAAAANLHVTGSMKFDGAETDRYNPRSRQLSRWLDWPKDTTMFLVGSTVQPEEKLAIAVFDRLHTRFPQLRLVLVPRHPERFERVARLVDESGHRWQRRSQAGDQRPDPNARILLIDTVGELADWWALADCGFVGGSLDGKRGGQSMIEPAAYGVPVCFGPYTHNFRGTVQLLMEDRAAVVVEDELQLERFVVRCLEEPGYASELGRRSAALVAQQKGATERTLDLLFQMLPQRAQEQLGVERIDPAHRCQGPWLTGPGSMVADQQHG